MYWRRLLVLVAGTCLLLTACAPQSQAVTAASSTPSIPSAPSPSPTPTIKDQLIVTLDGVTYVHAGKQTDTAFSNGSALIALFTSITGVSPTTAAIEDFPGYNSGLTSYTWDGIRIMAGGTYASISVTKAAVNGVPVTTGQGISVGSQRAEILAAKGWDVLDENGDGVAEYLGVGPRQVPGTTSLTHPGTTGIQFSLLVMDGDSVKQIQIPSDDFSDL